MADGGAAPLPLVVGACAGALALVAAAAALRCRATWRQSGPVLVSAEPGGEHCAKLQSETQAAPPREGAIQAAGLGRMTRV